MIDIQDKIYSMPFIALRGMCVFPNTLFSVDLIRRKSYDAMEAAMENDALVFMVSQIDFMEETIKPSNLYGMGVIARIKKVMRMPGSIARINVEGIARARIRSIDEGVGSYLSGEVVAIESVMGADEMHIQALLKLVSEAVNKYSSYNPRFLNEGLWEASGVQEIDARLDNIASRVELNPEDKQSLLEKFDIFDRGMELVRLINRENAILDIKKEISSKVKERVNEEQRKYYLREQLKVITDELENEGVNGEIDEYKDKMKALSLPEYATAKLNKEFDRLKRMPVGAQEGSVIRDYIDEVLSLPWGIYSEENNSLIEAEKILNRDHYGLEKVKERIIEFLAVKINNSNTNGSILCLVGPPGVGKTSVARSVAEALNRKYVRMSLGGVHDEAEIRGHRKTYIGSMPGRIIAAIKQAGTSNPLILLDEIDKLSSDYKGDPASAFLEVLDGEQNSTFRDNYLDMPYDLSRVLFICTANSLDTIPPALRDRMDIISLSSYTVEEKLEIAKKYLYPKQLKKHSLKKSELKINDAAFNSVIDGYTREAGVRQVERYIEKLCRIAVKDRLTGGKGISVTGKNVGDYLGKRIYKGDKLGKRDEVGVCRGLAWTAVGGTTLEVEVNTYEGKGEVKITGNVGKVMEESSTAAISYIRANAEKLGIDKRFDKTDVHIHIPEGATPKDGPSAGVTMVTAVVSAMTGIPVRHDIAMTGEVNIRGRVMPIGGLKEKVLAARRIGVKTVIIPDENSADLDEIPDYAKEGIGFVLAQDMDTVLENALCN
jgi:ATP-dependent Lon protease